MKNWFAGWVCGVWTKKTKNGTLASMESSNFAEIFGEELGLMRAGLTAGDIGNRFAASFVASVRRGLATEGKQQLAHVGTLLWNGETVSLDRVAPEMRDRAPLLAAYLKDHGMPQPVVGRTEFLFDKSVIHAEPMEGLFLLSLFGRDLLSRLQGEDSAKIRVCWEAACLVIHEAVACGADVGLGTLGLFTKDLTFEPYRMLIDTLNATHNTRTNRQTGASVFRARRLTIR